jgi:hypothetical protein
MRGRLLPDDHRVLAGMRRQVTDGGFEVELLFHLDRWSSKIENAVNSTLWSGRMSGTKRV